MKNYRFLYSLPLLLLMAAACQKTPNYGQTATVKMSNGWWITMSLNGTVVVDSAFFDTYNTASNVGDSLFLDDLLQLSAGGSAPVLGAYYPDFKCVAVADSVNLTFSASNSGNYYFLEYGAPLSPTVNIYNGKILPNAGHSTTGVATDSIYFQVNLAGIPDTFTVAGVARTGFDGDDHPVDF